MHGFYRIAAAIPSLSVAACKENTDEIISLWKRADKHGIALIAFPELAVSAYTCGDLFYQRSLLASVEKHLMRIVLASKDFASLGVIGAPLLWSDRLFNCAVVVRSGQILAVIPKSHLPNYKEFYEQRWFSSGKEIIDEQIAVDSQSYPFGTGFIFKSDEFRFGVEICEDLWSVIPPSSYQALAGSLLTLNLSASNDVIGKAAYRENLVSSQSARCLSAYLLCSSGLGESTTDTVYGGHALIAENGKVLKNSRGFSFSSELAFADIDVQKLQNLRLQETTYKNQRAPDFKPIDVGSLPGASTLERQFSKRPFVPKGVERRNAHCEEIFAIQSGGLAKRLTHTGLKKMVIGISGGLDSTLALLVCARVCKMLNLPGSGVVTVSMPGPGSSSHTQKTAQSLARLLGADLRVIDIRSACLQHSKDIGLSEDDRSVTFENIQARERTQILMDLANKESALVVGTGDLSELALGWSTYNGDHMSMYAVNSGVPKTLISYLISWIKDQHEDPKISEALEKVLNTPISPELLPGLDGNIGQKTEELIGPYELHDFFLYHMIRYGASPKKLLFLARHVFGDQFREKTLQCWLKVFIKRFFANQFKRSCLPDGPKVGTIALSPRSDWRMPSDSDDSLWLEF